MEAAQGIASPSPVSSPLSAPAHPASTNRPSNPDTQLPSHSVTFLPTQRPPRLIHDYQHPTRAQPRASTAAKLSPSDRVPLAIVALMHYNLNCPPNDRWFLSGNVIATAAGANPALVVTPWLQNHPAAVSQIDQHNSAIGLNARSNGKDKDRSQLKSIYQKFVEEKSIEELRAIARQFETQTD